MFAKFNKGIHELSTIIEKWAYFFRHGAETIEADVVSIAGSDIVIREAYQALNIASWSERELEIYERERKRIMDNIDRDDYLLKEGKREGIAQGLQEELEKGEENVILKVARNMLAAGADVNFVATTTGLSISQIEKLTKGG